MMRDNEKHLQSLLHLEFLPPSKKKIIIFEIGPLMNLNALILYAELSSTMKFCCPALLGQKES